MFGTHKKAVRQKGKLQEKDAVKAHFHDTLTRAERRQIEAAVARAKRTDKKEKSAQDSIPFQRMFPDGICRVTDSYYTKTIQFQDINYQLNQNEDKTAIFDSWCDFLNYFDSSIKFQLSFLNLSATRDSFAKSVTIPPQGDDFDSLRAEYTEMLRNQLAKGNNGLIKTKYLTFGIEADGLKAAKPRLERIEIDILNNFKRLGVTAASLNGTERLRLLHDISRWMRRSRSAFRGTGWPPPASPSRILSLPAPLSSKAAICSAWDTKLARSAFCKSSRRS